MRTLKKRVQLSIIAIGTAVILLVACLSLVWVTQTLNQNRLETAISYAVRYKTDFDYKMKNLTEHADLIQGQIERHFDRLVPDGTTSNLNHWMMHFDNALSLRPLPEPTKSKFLIFTLDQYGINSKEAILYADTNKDARLDKGRLVHLTLSNEATAAYRELLTGGTSYTFSDGSCLKNSTLTEGASEGQWYYIHLLRYMGKPIALLLCFGNSSEFDLNFEPDGLDANLQVAILNRQGQVLIRSEAFDSQWLDRTLPDSQRMVKDPATDVTATYFDLRNTPQALMRVHMINGWTLDYIFPTLTWFNTLMTMQWPLLWLFLGFLALVMLLSRLVLTQFDAPLSALYRQLDTADTQVPLPIFDQDASPSAVEIASLMDAYNQLAKYLQQTSDNLNQIHSDLEIKSIEKGRELLKINELLTASITSMAEQSEQLSLINSQLSQNVVAINEKRKELLDLEKMASLKYLVSGIAHELNTPIGNAITIATFLDHEIAEISKALSLSGGIRKSTLSESVKTVRTSLLQLSSNLKQGQQIIQTLDTLAVTDSMADYQKIDLSGFLEILVTTALQKYSQTVTFNLKHAPEVKYAFADPQKIQQLLLPLVDNSLVHGFSDTSRNPMIQIGLFVSKGDLVLEYSDNGKGVSWEERQHILTPFYSSDFGNHKGLGLSLAYNIVTHGFRGEFDFFDAPLGGLGIRCRLSQIQLLTSDNHTEGVSS